MSLMYIQYFKSSPSFREILCSIYSLQVIDGWNIVFRTSNKLKRVHLLVIELEHPGFGFERTNIEHRTN